MVLVAIGYYWYPENWKECINPDSGYITDCHNLGKDSEVYNCPGTNDHNSMYPNRWAGKYRINVLKPDGTSPPVLYTSTDENVIRWQLGLMKECGVDVLAFSYWGSQKPRTVSALDSLFTVLDSGTNPHPNLKVSIYYEDAGNRSVSTIKGDIDDIISNYGSNSHFYKVNSKPVFWIYGAASLSFFNKWNGIRNDKNLYIIQKQGSVWTSHLDLADWWHQYAPANRYIMTEANGIQYADGASAGFDRYHACARLCRSDTGLCNYSEFDDAVKSMKDSSARYHIIFWNEWQENSGIEPATRYNHIEGPASNGGFTRSGEPYGKAYLNIIKKYFGTTTICTTPTFNFEAR